MGYVTEQQRLGAGPACGRPASFSLFWGQPGPWEERSAVRLDPRPEEPAAEFRAVLAVRAALVVVVPARPLEEVEVGSCRSGREQAQHRPLRRELR
jgi:hypothetical protein